MTHARGNICAIITTGVVCLFTARMRRIGFGANPFSLFLKGSERNNLKVPGEREGSSEVKHTTSYAFLSRLRRKCGK